MSEQVSKDFAEVRLIRYPDAANRPSPNDAVQPTDVVCISVSHNQKIDAADAVPPQCGVEYAWVATAVDEHHDTQLIVEENSVALADVEKSDGGFVDT